MVHQPNDVKVIDTSAFIKTKIDYGLDFVFHLIDSVTLTILSLIDNGVSGFACGTDVRGRREEKRECGGPIFNTGILHHQQPSPAAL